MVIARVLTLEPKMLLLDEQTSNLDLKNQLAVLRIIEKGEVEFWFLYGV